MPGTIVFCFLFAVVFANSPARVSRQISITRADESTPSSLGLVNGLRSCGGPGQVLEIRHQSCNSSGPCQVPGDGQPRPSEMLFIPSQDVETLGIRFLVVTDKEVLKAYDRPISDSTVQGGEKYVVHALAGAAEDLKGQSVTIQLLLYHVDNNNVEVCGEADVQVV